MAAELNCIIHAKYDSLLLHMKINRNDPCPCGSGKKYKKCHGLADQEAKKIQRTYQLREGAENPLVAFANSIISAVTPPKNSCR